MTPLKLVKYLGNLGYGTRRDVASLVRHRHVTRANGVCIVDGEDVLHHEILVRGEPLDPPPGSVVVMHKPAGYVTSTREASRLVYELLPPRWLRRTPVMAPVGRLDRDTTGLLLFTDDGALNHRLTSPKRHLPKTYDVTLASDLRGDEHALFAAGSLALDGEKEPLLPASLVVHSPRVATVTVTEGRYHQVRRMFAAVGNHVVSLHRSAVGELVLGELDVGQWRLLAQDEVTALRDASH